MAEDTPSQERKEAVRGEQESTAISTLMIVLLFLSIVVPLLFVGISGTFLSLHDNNLDLASKYVDILSSMGTIALVALTAYYAYNTKRQVEIADQSRRERARREKQEQQRQRQNLRKALCEEISRTPELEDAADTVAMMDQPVPNAVYQQNSANLGILNEEEVAAVVEYYNAASLVQSMSRVYRSESEEGDLKDEHEEVLNELLDMLSDNRSKALEALNSSGEGSDTSSPSTEVFDKPMT